MAFDEENVIEITDDDGTVLRCELYDILDYEGKQYALLFGQFLVWFFLKKYGEKFGHVKNSV